MTDFKGACVVLIPGPNDLPNEVEGGQHITLAYFGDENLSEEDYSDLLGIVDEMADQSTGFTYDISVRSEEFFGENGEAHVLTLDPTPNSIAVTLRKQLLASLTPDLLDIFQSGDRYPTYRPHLTLGYLNEGYSPSGVEIPESISIVGLGVWNGGNRINIPFPPAADDELAHYGTPRKSGRYPWGSGDNPAQRNKLFLDHVATLRKQGMSEVEIARAMDMKTSELRAKKTIAKNEQQKALASEALKLHEKGLSNSAIAARMGLAGESSVRALLNPATQDRRKVLNTTTNKLREAVEQHKFLDVGAGIQNHMGVSDPMLKAALAVLKEEGYVKRYVDIPQLGTGKMTTMRVLVKEDVPYPEVAAAARENRVGTIATKSKDFGRTFDEPLPPLSIDSKRVGIRYAEDGGTDADGVVYVRRGVPDVSLGKARYAQVRIAVDDTHFIKGMAMYKDDMPDGVDLVFNTNKKNTGNKLDALKKMKEDEENPFGALYDQIYDKPGHPDKKVTSVMNLVNEEGKWNEWSKNLSSQMLSKQSPTLAKQQLDLAFASKKAAFDEAKSLTNPVVKKALLESLADDVEASATHLKAAALPRQRTQVILPINSLKDNEVYAPQFRPGEKVVLIRFPHGGKFEIPELVVNNKNKEAQDSIGQAKDAIGINSKVASRLSGADFDGDTVLVIPNNRGMVKSESPLKGLQDFDPQAAYKPYDGMKTMDGGIYNAATKSIDYQGKRPNGRMKQREMGDISNLITDMTIQGASHPELARAVRHSMVVIDAEKHVLNYKQSAKDNGIAELKQRYQGGPRAGAATLISKRKGRDPDALDRRLQKVNELAPPDPVTGKVPIDPKTGKPATVKTVGPIDPKTGKRIWVETGDGWYDSKGKWIQKKAKISKMEATDDAHTLVSKDGGTPMEHLYADHANRLKALANETRKEFINTQMIPYSPSAKAAYAPQVAKLKASLNVALMNAPLERQAQLLANQIVAAKKAANPSLQESDLKKIKGQALTTARERVGARKERIDISPDQWEAIQAGAISSHMLGQILSNADMDQVKKYALPREAKVVDGPTLSRAKSMLASGYMPSEIADALSIDLDTVNSALNRE